MQREGWYFIESHENTMLEFLFCYLKKWECKKNICGTFFTFV